MIAVGSDYNQAVGEPVTFFFNAANDNHLHCAPFDIINDLVPENTEFFCVTLVSNEPSGSVIVDPSNATVTIIDDDGRKSHEPTCFPISYN